MIRKFFMMLGCILIFSNLDARWRKLSSYMGQDNTVCNTEETCATNMNCKCFCAQKGDYRAKEASDAPVWDAAGINGIHCFCKQWDLDAYKNGKQGNGTRAFMKK